MDCIRIATYNVHKCRGMDRRIRPGRIAEVLQEIQPDVIGLQEVLSFEDGPPERNQAQFLAEQLGMYLVIGENRRITGGSYGNVVLSRFPVSQHCNHDVTVPGRERRGCLRADVTLPNGQLLHLFNVHFGTGFLERRQQARLLFQRELLRGEDLRCTRVILGDFNEWTAGHLTRALRSEFRSVDIRKHIGRARTYPGWLPVLHLDHIYYDEDLTVERAELHRTRKSLVASDHLPIMAEFRVNSTPTYAESGNQKASGYC